MNNTFDELEIINAMSKALKLFLSENGINYLLNAQERAIAGRLAIHLSNILENKSSECAVDIEYNRSGKDRKILCGYCEKYDECHKCRHWCAPDIVFHERGNNNNNKLFCEIKKSDNNIIDKAKVKTAIDNLYYQYGIVIYKFNKSDIKLLLLNKSNESKYYYDFDSNKLIRDEL